MATKRVQATFKTSLASGAGARRDDGLSKTVLAQRSGAPIVTAVKVDVKDQFDPDFKILDEIMDRDAEALRALAK